MTFGRSCLREPEPNPASEENETSCGPHMSILLSSDVVWEAANWIVTSFFEDAAAFVIKSSPLGQKLELCFMAQLSTLDMELASREDLDDLATTIDKVIDRNENLRGSNFHDPAGFPVYLGKLRELRDLVQRQLAGAVS